MERTNGNEVVVNGVPLPNHVVLELQRLGRALEWYNAGELKSAVLACAVDRKLIDDPNGANFIDQLELTDEEKRKAEGNVHNLDEHRESKEKDECESEHKSEKGGIWGFCKRLKEGRIRRYSYDDKIAC